MPKLSSDDYYDIADNLAQASAAILASRVRTPGLTAAERAALQHAEDELDHRVVMFRNYGIAVSGMEAAEAKQRIQAAVGKAKVTMRRIQSARKAIALAASLIGLAASITARNADGILAAIGHVQDAVKLAGANGASGTSRPARGAGRRVIAGP
jgi:hypothetical protein